MPTKKAVPRKPSPVKRLAQLRRQRDDALVDANLQQRMGRSGESDLKDALSAAIAIDKLKGYY